MIYRKSIIGLIWLIIKGLLLAAVIIFVGYLVKDSQEFMGYFLAVAGIIVVIGTAAYVYSYISTYLVVTDDYVALFTQVSVFGTEQAKAEMLEIEDVLVNKSGIFRIIFDFGTLTVQTVGTKPNFTNTALARPEVAKAQIIQLSTGK